MTEENYGSIFIAAGIMLLIAFVVLKLSNIISWSWWVVLTPVWIFAALFIGIFILVIAFFPVDDER